MSSASQPVILTEDKIRDHLFNSFTSAYRVVVKEWRGWPIKTARGRSESHFFWRSFDIAMFERSPSGLIFTGYEVKGVIKERKKKGEREAGYRYPSFGEGLDQALVLLYQGADYSYLVYPEPKEDKMKTEMKKFIERFARPVGLIFIDTVLLNMPGLFSIPYKQAERNYVDESEKKRLLTSLLSGGYFSDITVADWAKKHEY